MDFRFQSFKKLGDVDCSGFLRALHLDPELWDILTVRQDFEGSAHADTRAIFLRGPERMEWDCVETLDYYGADAMFDVYEDVVGRIMRLLPISEMGRMMLVELKPHGRILEHSDEGAYAEHFDRFHIAVTESPRASLTVGGQRQSFRQGECWWFNHRDIHSAENLDDRPRIHLIFDAVLSNYSLL